MRITAPMKIILASTNLHKIRELKAILKRFPQLDLYSLRDYPDYTPPEETGATFEENVKLKALHAAKTLNEYVLADDSGLVIPALEGEPGVRSARYAGEEATDKDNRNKLIKKLLMLREDERIGYYECCIAIATPVEIDKIVQGICEGTLLTEPRGSNGFGYDSLFIKYDYSKTFAELDEETKNKISHRRKALDKLQMYLESCMCTTS